MSKKNDIVNIALVTMRPEIGKKEKNIEKMRSFISKKQADLYIFGETPVTGYRCKDELFRLAEPINGPTIKKLSQTAKENNAAGNLATNANPALIPEKKYFLFATK